MPTYDYECQKCGHHFEKFQSMSDPVLKTCPKCKGKVNRMIGSGAGLHFKGEGFYITDYRSKSYQERAKSDAAGAKSESSSGDGGTSKSADGGPSKSGDSAPSSSGSSGGAKSEGAGTGKSADSGATGGGKGAGPVAKDGGTNSATPRSGSTSARKASSGSGNSGGTGNSGRSRKPSN